LIQPDSNSQQCNFLARAKRLSPQCRFRFYFPVCCPNFAACGSKYPLNLHLGQLIAAGVQGFVLWMIARVMLWAWRKKPPSEWLFLVAVLLGSFLLFGLLGAVVGTDKLPKLKGQILLVNAGEMRYTPALTPKAVPRDAGVAQLVVAISNTGAPSIATDYTLTIKFASGVTKIGQSVAIPNEGLRMPHKAGQAGGVSETIYREDHLPRKTIQPIPKGGSVQGILLFAVEGATMQDLRSIGTSYHLEFKDLWGALYTVDVQNTGIADVLMDFPGLRDSNVQEEKDEDGAKQPPSPTPNKGASPH